MGRRPSQSHRRSSEGFTLLEVTIAIAVFAVGMLSLSAMLIAAMQGGSRGRHTTQASAVAESRMEQLHRLTWTELTNANACSTPQVVNNTVQGNTSQNEETYTSTCHIADLVTGWTREIDVSVTWDDPGRPNRRVTFSSIRFNREGL